MKKLIIGGVLALFIGGVAKASAIEINTNKSALLQAIAQEEGLRIIGEGTDAGGHYYIVATSMECRKVYPQPSNAQGMVQ